MAAPDAGTFDHFYYGELPATAPGADAGTFDHFQFGELPLVFHPALLAPPSGALPPRFGQQVYHQDDSIQGQEQVFV